MQHVVNNGADISVVVDGERHIIPPGESEQSEAVLGHQLCEHLMSERTPIMEPKGDDEDRTGEMVERKGYRLVVDGKIPSGKEGADKAKKLKAAAKKAQAASKKEAAAKKKAEGAAKKKADEEAKKAAEAAAAAGK